MLTVSCLEGQLSARTSGHPISRRRTRGVHSSIPFQVNWLGDTIGVLAGRSGPNSGAATVLAPRKVAQLPPRKADGIVPGRRCSLGGVMRPSFVLIAGTLAAALHLPRAAH